MKALHTKVYIACFRWQAAKKKKKNLAGKIRSWDCWHTVVHTLGACCAPFWEAHVTGEIAWNLFPRAIARANEVAQVHSGPSTAPRKSCWIAISARFVSTAGRRFVVSSLLVQGLQPVECTRANCFQPLELLLKWKHSAGVCRALHLQNTFDATGSWPISGSKSDMVTNLSRVLLLLYGTFTQYVHEHAAYAGWKHSDNKAKKYSFLSC